MTSAFEHLCGPGKPLRAEPPDKEGLEGLIRSGRVMTRMATIVKPRSGTWKAIIRKTDWLTSSKTLRTKRAMLIIGSAVAKMTWSHTTGNPVNKDYGRKRDVYTVWGAAKIVDNHRTAQKRSAHLFILATPPRKSPSNSGSGEIFAWLPNISYK